jgi:hypothetical protein
LNELQTVNYQLPDTLQDLAKFVLVIPDKISSVKSEIHAMMRLDLAKEVVEQKKEELKMLTEAYIDATVRVGDLTKQIEKKQGVRTDLQPTATGEGKLKSEVVKELGFGESQVLRFEKMSNNKDVVEQVKAECRETGEPLTQSKVLSLIDEKKKRGRSPTIEEAYYEDVIKPSEDAYKKGCEEIDQAFDAGAKIDNVLMQLENMPFDDYHIECYVKYYLNTDFQRNGRMIELMVAKLEKIKNKAKELNSEIT